MMNRQRLREAGSGNIDKLYSQISKCSAAIQKAQSALMDAADSFDEVLVESQAIGGKIAQIVPSHIKMHIAKLTDIADKELGPIIEGEGPSSINKLQELIGSIPYREIRPMSADERRASISLQPNLTNGPQSAISAPQINESIEDYYRRLLNEQSNINYDDSSLSFNALRETEIFGNNYDEDLAGLVSMKQSQPISRKVVREQMRAAADDAMFEDTDMEQLSEGVLDFNNIKAFGGKDGMPLKFDTLSDTGHVVG